jgi:hypothetical protein
MLLAWVGVKSKKPEKEFGETMAQSPSVEPSETRMTFPASRAADQKLLDAVIGRARTILQIEIGETAYDLWLWEHTARVYKLVDLFVRIPEIARIEADPLATAVAALFHDAGWIVQYSAGKVERSHILSRPTNDLQRELGATSLQEACADFMPPNTLRMAIDAIRFCNDRQTESPEAKVLAEAESLDEIGLTYFLRMYRQYQAEGRPTSQLVSSWRRQKEYHYWEMRLVEGFRFDAVRELARRRLERVDRVINSLETDIDLLDVQSILPLT